MHIERMNTYGCYVMPRLLFGLESIFTSKKHLKLHSDFHLDTLQKLQTLPSRTSNAAVLPLLGTSPIEAELDKNIWTVLFSCIKSVMKSLLFWQKRLSWFHDSEWRSFFTKVKHIHELPDINSICDIDISIEQ